MKVKVAIVGAGRMGSAHLEALGKMEDVDVVAICDTNSEAAGRMAGIARVPAYSDLSEAIKRERPDAAFICTPAFSRAGQEILAAREGVHLFVEKPPALSLFQGEKVAEAIERSKIVNSVGYCWRYSKVADKLLETFDGRRVALIIAQWLHTIPPISWVRSKELGGGQIVDQSTHLIDLMRYLVGEVESIYAQASRGLFPDIPDFTGDDGSAAALTFRSGTVATLSSTYSLFPAEGHGPRIAFIGRELRAECGQKWMEIVTREGAQHFDFGDDDQIYAEDRVFIDAVKGKDTSGIKSPFSDALKTLAVTLAANRSIETGEVVRL
ncbi:MAG: Gfo/Idh/MocA family protein [bacterium]